MDCKNSEGKDMPSGRGLYMNKIWRATGGPIAAIPCSIILLQFADGTMASLRQTIIAGARPNQYNRHYYNNINISDWTPTQLLIDRHTRLAFDWIQAHSFASGDRTGPSLANHQSLSQPAKWRSIHWQNTRLTACLYLK